MDHIVPQTTPSQNQTQREEYKVYTNLRNNQSLTSSNGFYKYADDLYDKHNSHVYPTPANVDQLERALKSHPDRLFVQKLYTELREGAKIGYMGPRTSKESRNLPSANKNPDTIHSNLAKEVELGRTAGTFDNRPPPPPLPFPNFQVCPIGLVPKKNSLASFVQFSIFLTLKHVAPLILLSPRKITLYSIQQLTMRYMLFRH